MQDGVELSERKLLNKFVQSERANVAAVIHEYDRHVSSLPRLVKTVHSAGSVNINSISSHEAKTVYIIDSFGESLRPSSWKLLKWNTNV